ncbi:glycosyltransferase [uncultured Selenomonas sp.]|uniref:glycosyltransferase n=1 Tax=uncultured Selenomonas sp. TaxID=159275 RepID=UPI0028E99A86|nr:glycosyltransferase [uncultured Selenomonas sp.]
MNSQIRLIEYGALTSSVGGVEVYIKNQAESMSDRIHMDFLVPNEPHLLAFEDFWNEKGFKIYRCYRRWKDSFFGHYIDLIKFFYKHRKEYDIAVANLLDYQNINFLIVAKLFGLKTVAHAHSSNAQRNWKYRLFVPLNRVLSIFFVDVLFSCSKDAAFWMFGKDLWEKKETYIVRNRIDLSRFQSDPTERMKKRRDLGADKETLIIGHTGRLTHGKNHVFMLQVLKCILNKRKNAILIFIGDGELMETLRRTATDYGVSSNVRFMGRQGNVAAWLQAMDVFFFPSDHEGMPLSLIEAQAAGLPCIVSDAVPKEAGVTPLCRFLSLEAPVETWAEALLTARRGGDENHHGLLRRAGYDMANNKTESVELYCKLLNK